MLKKTLLCTMFAAVAVAGSAAANDKPSAEAAIDAAKSAQAEAAAVGGEWRDTGDIIKQAEEALGAGNFGTAVGLAQRAEQQGRLGKEQALSQVGAGNPTYLYN